MWLRLPDEGAVNYTDTRIYSFLQRWTSQFLVSLINEFCADFFKNVKKFHMGGNSIQPVRCMCENISPDEYNIYTEPPETGMTWYDQRQGGHVSVPNKRNMAAMTSSACVL